jgi:L-ascorbate metabolism protein UlaG (beta-lactamase superfamily)
VKITHLGHSCVLVEIGEARILIDPGAFTHGFEELTGLDAVLVTHQHLDHLDVERLPVLLEANPEARLLTEAEAAAELEKVGIEAEPLHVGNQIRFGAAQVTGVGGIHAEIHADIPRVGNVGLLLSEDGGSTLFHPGDAYAAVPAGVDILAVPLSAPWAKFSETADFVRAVRPGLLFPIHEAVLSPPGRAIYLRNLQNLLPEGAELVDLVSAEPTTF